MASRVNTRFVAILLVVLLVLAGGVAVAARYALKKTGEQHAAMAEKLMQQGDYEKAIEHWGKAVNKNQGNAAWCARWADALEKTTPTPRQAYADRFITDYLMALRGLSDAAPTDVAAQKRYLEMRFRHVQKTAGGDLRAWESIVAVVDDVLGRFGDNPEAGATLRRYRGLAQVALSRIVGAAQRPKEEVQQSEADLKAAIAADPADEESVVGLATWAMLAAQQARLAGDAPGAEGLTQRARTLLQDFVRQHPPASRSALAILQLDAGEAIRQAPTAPRHDALLAQRVDQLRDLAARVRAESKEKLDPPTVVVVYSYLTSVPELGEDAAREVMESALERRPNDPYLLVALGRAQLTQRKSAEALATLQKVFDLPDPPLSLDGLLLFGMRAEAVRWQVQAKLSDWDLAKTPADRAAALKGAEGYRDTLVRYLGENEALVLLIDAKLDVARGDSAGARTKLDQYNQLTNNNDTEAVIILADIMTREGNLGTAYDLYKKLLARDSNNTRLLKLMAGVEARQHDYQAAAERYRAVLAIDPGDAEATEQLKTASDLAGGPQSPVPYVRAMARAQELASGLTPDYEAASAVLREAIAAGSDEPALYLALARVRMLNNDQAGTGEAIDQGLVKHPDDQRLKDFKRLLGTGDPLDNLLRVIDESAASDLNKTLLKFMAFTRAGKPDKAREALAKAAEIDKNSPAVLEFQFQFALSERDGAAARRIADAAAAVDADHAQGKWYRARIEIAENRLEEGAAMLEQIVSRDKLNVDVWRLLGSTRLTMGQPKAAVEAYGRVLEIRPSDIPSIVGFLKAKGLLKEYDTALAVARQKQDVAGSDPDFVDVWLALETLAAGGDKNKALEMRQQLARRFPKADRNNMALAGLLMEQKRWGEAKAVIDALMAEKADAQYVDLLSRWHAAQGNGAAARAAVDAYVATLPQDKPADGPYIVLAQTLAGYRQMDAALSAMEEARKRQDKKEMNGDRSLGDMYFSMEQYDRAAQTYQRVLDAGSPDKGAKLVKRILECDLRLARYEDARRRLDSLGDAVETDTVLMMTKAEVLGATGKRPEARELLDRAVAATKDEPTAYIRRADFLSRDLETIGDAEADLRQAMKLDPGSQLARQRLVALCVMAGRWADAVGTLREGLAMDPENDDLRVMLVALHLDRKETDDAVAVIEQVLRRRPDDPVWLGHAARVAASAGRWAQSVRYSERVWQLARTPEAAMLYVDGLLRLEPPDTAKAMLVMQTPELKVTENMPLLMTRARVYFRQGGKSAEATQDALAALALCKDDPAMLDSWFGTMEIIFPDPALRLRAVLELKPPGGFTNWRAAFLAALKGTVPEAREEGMSELRQNAEANPQPDFRRFAYATLGSYAHSAKKDEEAIEYWRKGLAIYPNDPELNNNIAYVLAAKMGRPEEARPYAEKAAAAVPNNAAILDTLGAVYLALNDKERAETVLMRAIGVAKGREIPPILLRLGQLRVAQGNKRDAERYLRLLDDAIANDGVTKAEYETDADELRRKISAM